MRHVNWFAIALAVCLLLAGLLTEPALSFDSPVSPLSRPTDARSAAYDAQLDPPPTPTATPKPRHYAPMPTATLMVVANENVNDGARP